MKELRLIALLLMLLALSACKEEGPSYAPCRIELASVLDSPETKAAYQLSAPTTEKPLHAAVWLSTVSHSYPGTQAGKDDESATFIDYHNHASFTGSTKQLLVDQLYYPSNLVPVYLIGLYPCEGWTVASNANGTSNVARFTFTGKEDVMFAPEVHNSLSTSAHNPVLHFSHALTWLRFRFVAMDQETADAWGPLQSVTVRSRNQLSIDVTDNARTFTESVAGCRLPLFKLADEQPLEGQSIALPLSTTELAYILCEPVQSQALEGTTEYELTLSTANRQNVVINLNLRNTDGSSYEGSTAGHQFTVTLRFVQGDNILTSATVSEWRNGGTSIIQVTE